MQIDTLKKNREFNLTYSRGKSYPSRHLVLICLKRKYGRIRIGFSVSKKIGGAVVRNRVRRRLKEAVRGKMDSLSGNYYLIFIARKGIEKIPYSVICADMEKVLFRAGLIKEKEEG